MQRPSGGYRGGIRLSHQKSSNYHPTESNTIGNGDDDDDDRTTLSNSNSDENDELDDDNHEEKLSYEIKKPSSLYSKISLNADFESAIRSLRPSAACQKKTKHTLNMSHQKADLPQLNNENEHNPSSQNSNHIKSDDKTHQESKSRRWFPKAEVGHVDSTVFIRQNHAESKKVSDTFEQSAPPAMLTTMPPVGISTRPTAVIAPAGTNRSASALFSSKSLVTQGHGNESTSKYNEEGQQPKPSFLVRTPSSAFQPIQNLPRQKSSSVKNIPVLIDIPQHKTLEPGQLLHRVHISHPQSPTVVHLMLHENFTTACRLLREMTAHPEFQIDYVPKNPFKAQVNRLCACCHEGRWFRCRILKLSADGSTATVSYLDWGMTVQLNIGPESMRRLPNEFYVEPVCSVMCHLDGVPQTNESITPDVVAKCLSLLSENEYDVFVNAYDRINGGQIVLSIDGRIINHQIKQLLHPDMTSATPIALEDELVEQFRHELPLTVGDELKALLSSFSGKDDSFYVLLVNEDTLAIDQAMSEFQETSNLLRSSLELPRVKSIVAARYADDGKWYRAWIKSICLQRKQAVVFFVDFGNESTVDFTDIYTCPESVRSLPWLGIRIRLIDEKMTYDELVNFWKLAESNYIWIKILQVFQDSYGVQIKLDYTIFLRQDRMKIPTSHRFAHASTQVSMEINSIPRLNSLTNSENHSTLVTPCLSDQISSGNENLFRNLFEMIAQELRHLRHRINDSDEASQDRHNQLMQLLISSFNSNNSNNSKRL